MMTAEPGRSQTVETGAVGAVLIVDDIAANRAVMARRLEMLGHSVTCVDSGRAALQAIAANPPDLVLLDYMMPEMNGLEVLKIIRSDEHNADLPVIMVTARAESEATVDALEAGADDYVTKPIDYNVLNARIEGHMQRNRSKLGLKKANAALDDSATMRNMVVSDLEADLANEIKRRTAVEAQLQKLQSVPAASVEGAGEGEAGAIPAPLQDLLSQIHDQFELICGQAFEGKNPNLAQLQRTRSLIEATREFWAD